MGATTYTDDVLTVSPPLNPTERNYLRRLARSAAGRIHRPGSSSPWWPSDDGTTLAIPDYGTKEPIAEWAHYLATRFLGPTGPDRHGRRLSRFTYDHRLSGTLGVRGRTHGDRWTLEAGDTGVLVHREHMPCPSCWVDMLLRVRPTEAYRFLHPVREANLLDGVMPQFDRKALEEQCLTRTWTPVGRTTRQIRWPWSGGYWSGWWIDLEATPEAVPFHPEEDDRWESGLADVIDLFPA